MLRKKLNLLRNTHNEEITYTQEKKIGFECRYIEEPLYIYNKLKKEIKH